MKYRGISYLLTLWITYRSDLSYSQITFDKLNSSPLDAQFPPSNLQNIEQDTRFLKTGTTIVGICCRDGIVLGADTRATGDVLVIDKNKLKIHLISTKIYCCGAGTSADCDQICRLVSFDLANLRIESQPLNRLTYNDFIKSDSVQTAARLISRSIRKKHHRDRSAVFILGGVDDNGGSLYEIESDGSHQRIRFTALGSGSPYALAFLENELGKMDTKSLLVATQDSAEVVDDENAAFFEDRVQISVNDAIDIVRKAVKAGISNDLGSGSHVDICIITQNCTKLWREESGSSPRNLENTLRSGANLRPKEQKSLADPPQKDQQHLQLDSNYTSGKLLAAETVGEMTGLGKLVVSSRKLVKVMVTPPLCRSQQQLSQNEGISSAIVTEISAPRELNSLEIEVEKLA